MTGTQTSTKTSGTSCPYATVVQEEEVSQDQESLLARCPAFANEQCPFKAQSPEQVRATLAQVPPSHWSKEGPFYKVLSRLHQIQDSIQQQEFHLPGGCPVRDVIATNGPQGNTTTLSSFRDAMESYSLAAVMAKLAREQYQDEEEEEENEPNGHHRTSVTTSIGTDNKEPLPSRNTKLSQSLKSGTAVSHQTAEDVHFVRNFIQGKIDKQLYGQLVTRLYHVYDTLERCLDECAQNHFPSCHFPTQLNRRQALAEDMDFWNGTEQLPLSPATKDYVQRLEDLLHNDPMLLLAHSYTRYLGDLSGGRILARVARKALQLGNDGLAFYEFQHVKSPKLFKEQYRQALDDLALNDAQIQALVAEANVAFLLNVRLFEELDVIAGVKGAKVRPLEEALSYAHAAHTKVAENEKCPFLVQRAPVTAPKRCPWPFILAHDPVEGMKDWQTWAVVGLILCWMWSRVQA